MTKDERLKLRKPQISCKPAHNFVKCLPPFFCPQSWFALFVGRASVLLRPMHTALRLRLRSLEDSRAVPQPRSWRAVEGVPVGCQCTHANGDSGSGFSWTLCPVEVLLYLEMNEITFFTSTVTKHNFSEIYADTWSIHLKSFRTGNTTWMDLIKSVFVSSQLQGFCWNFVGDGWILCFWGLPKAPQPFWLFRELPKYVG